MSMRHEIARYYDRNTGWFRLWERSRTPFPVHRAVRGDGVTTRAEALDFVHRRVLEHATEIGARSVIDLGCGTGALLDYLARRRDFSQLIGVTASSVQARGASRWFAAASGLRVRPEVRPGTFLDPSLFDGGAGPRLFVAIESMVHAAAGALLRSVRVAAEPGDHLFVCDDFLAPGHDDAGLVERFRAGWRAPGLVTSGELDELAARVGFVQVSAADWSAGVPRPGRIGRVFHRTVSAVLAPLVRAPFFGNLSGGAALRAGYGSGLFRYEARLYAIAEAGDAPTSP